MKNGLHTSYKGYELELSSLENGKFEIIYRGVVCPFSNFIKHDNSVNYLSIESKDLTNAYFVTTHAVYEGFKFQISNKKEDLLQLVTSEHQAYEKLSLEMVERGYYLKWVRLSELERVWEERVPALNLPKPEAIESIKEISISN